MTSQTPDPEPPRVTTEPQRQALDAMSQALVEKLNLMVEEQHRRVEEFTRLEHSLSQRPMEFRMPENSAPQATEPVRENHSSATIPQPNSLSDGAAGNAVSRAAREQAAPAPASRAGCGDRPLPPVPPIPPVPPVSPAASTARNAAPARPSSAQPRTSGEMPAHHSPPRYNDAARGSAREPGTLQGLLELLGLGGKNDSEAGESEAGKPATSTWRPAPQTSNSEGTKGCLYSLLIIIFLVIAARSCS